MTEPLACNMIRDLAPIYIKNGLVIKNRYGDSDIKSDNNLTKWLEMSDNNLVIEKNGVISIYCTKDVENIYENIIEYIKNNFNTKIDIQINIYLVNKN